MPKDSSVNGILEEHARIEAILAEDRLIIKAAIQQAAEVVSPLDNFEDFVDAVLDGLR